MMGCRNCGHESHCGLPLRDVGLFGRENSDSLGAIICHNCVCEKCEKNYEKWSKTSDQYSEWEDDEDSYTDERIV
tara:strand:- start:284 stop:508 length:225 start_codon:yes stop_codon:yes gene_type:complete